MKSKGEKGALIGAAKSPAHRATRDRLALGAAGSRSRTNAGRITKAMCFYAPEKSKGGSLELDRDFLVGELTLCSHKLRVCKEYTYILKMD